MTMTKQTKLIMSIAAGIGIVAAIGLGIYLYSKQTSSDSNSNQPTDQSNNPVNTGLPTDQPPTNTTSNQPNTNTPVENTNANSAQNQEEEILRLARTFTERYGSYSNRNNFENITRLEAYMTEAFQKKSLEYIDANQQEGIPEEYYGISTTAVSLKLANYKEEASATVHVSTRRVETRSTQDPKIYNQDAVLEFKNVAGNWKVDSFTWK